MVQISNLSKFEQQEVVIKGWVINRRTSKGLVFLVMRDGSGFVQAIADETKVSAEAFETAKSVPYESSVTLTGTVIKDERQLGGFEIQISNIEIISASDEYPISNKAHGVEFLMDNRHLWLRSKRQWAIMRIRNRIIFSIHEFFQGEEFVQMDAPIFTGNAVEGTTTLFETEFYDKPAYLTQSGHIPCRKIENSPTSFGILDD